MDSKHFRNLYMTKIQSLTREFTELYKSQASRNFVRLSLRRKGATKCFDTGFNLCLADVFEFFETSSWTVGSPDSHVGRESLVKFLSS